MLKYFLVLSLYMKNQYIAPCGMDCEKCDIRLMPFNDEAAKKVIPWCRFQGWISQNEGLSEMMEKNMYCVGCRNRQKTQWNEECSIYHCCVEEKNLEFCSDCSLFICPDLEQWGKLKESNRQSLERLKKGIK